MHEAADLDPNTTQLCCWHSRALCAWAAAPAPSAYAQGKYPTRSPRLVLPFAAGGVADVTARIVAEKLGDVLGHRFIVDNQPGAGGINAANTVRSARPDGYALALLSNGTAVSVGCSTTCRSIP